MKKYIKSILYILLSVFFFQIQVQAGEDELGAGLADYSQLYGYDQNRPMKMDLGPAPSEYKYVAIFVDFPDEEMEDFHLDAEESVENAKRFLNSGEGTVVSTKGQSVEVVSLQEYVKKYSYGKVKVSAEIFPKNEEGNVICYRSKKNRSYYMPYKESTNQEGYQGIVEQDRREIELIEEIMEGVKPQLEAYYSESELDADNDGYVDAISFFIEAKDYTQESMEVSWSDLLWSHKISGVRLKNNIGNKKVWSYNLINAYDYQSPGGIFSSIRPTYGTIIHEFLHILGYMDLYRYTGSGGKPGTPVGEYDIMASTRGSEPQGMLAYMLSEYGNSWHDPLENVDSSKKGITLYKPRYENPSEKTAIKVYSPKNSNEFFTVEYYEETSPTSNYETGLLVSRINEEKGSKGNMLTGMDGYEDLLYVMRPGDTGLRSGNGLLSKATLNLERTSYGKPDGMEIGSIDLSTYYYCDGSNSGIAIKVTDMTEDSITFDLIVMQEEKPSIPQPDVTYTTHVQSYGWQETVKNGELAGTTGVSKRLEGIKIALSDEQYGSVEYKTHVQTYGWQDWVTNGMLSGTQGESKRLEAIQIRLTGELAEKYDIYYRVHAQKFGWLDWAKNGEKAGTATYGYRLEAIEIRICDKQENAPGSTQVPYYSREIQYRTHVQKDGWQNWVYDGEMSGTSGRALRLEAIAIQLTDQEYSGEIRYQTHVQKIGWQEWRKNGEIAGTSGQSLRLEAVKLELTGEMKEHYDLYYRVHVQTYGWQGWKKNGETAGTSGEAKRLEAIEILLLPIGTQPPEQ